MRLRWRLAAVTVLLLAAALAFAGVAQYVVLRGYLLERTYATAAEQASIAGKLSGRDGEVRVPDSGTATYDSNGSRITAALTPASKPGAPTMPWVEPSPDQVRSLMIPPTKTGPRAGPLAGPLAGLAGWLPGRGWTIVRAADGTDLMLSVVPTVQDRFLVVETPLSEVDALLGADVGIFAAVAGLALLGTAVLAVWLTSRTLSPLERVVAVAREVSGGALDRRTGLRGADELARLGAAFDEMVDRLEEQIRLERESEVRMRRFLADASHELRTPVSGILGHLEVLRRGAMDSRADLEESLAAMHLTAERMARLVRDLLTLTRFEQAEARLRAGPVDADELVREAARAARPSTRDHLVVLEPAAGDLALLGDRDAAERILVNLLDNAAKYSPPGSRISLAARRAADDRVELVVSDHGPGIPPEERERVFERLYRGDRSRATTAAGQGAGLGLAICRALARRQGGDVTVRDAPGGGATFVVTLPGCGSGDR